MAPTSILELIGELLELSWQAGGLLEASWSALGVLRGRKKILGAALERAKKNLKTGFSYIGRKKTPKTEPGGLQNEAPGGDWS